MAAHSNLTLPSCTLSAPQRDFVQKVDPDVVTGWNAYGFDFRFMFERAQELCIESSCGNLGRDANVLSTLEKKKSSLSAMGDNEFFVIQMRG